ncbi:MAG: hypothetical protein MAG451_00047 [Anaerolineales bacterium]|nr:hypothetical protein [Anaerolineales bacterium]
MSESGQKRQRRRRPNKQQRDESEPRTGPSEASGETVPFLDLITDWIDKYGEHPALAILDRETDLGLVGLDHLDKDHWRSAIRHAAKNLGNVKRIVMIAPAWSAPPALFGGPSPSENPARQEVISVTEETRIRQRGWVIPLLRDDAGRPHLGEPCRAEIIHGRFLGILYRPDLN